ncbi:MAG: hypothetical protein ACYTGC_15650, partial [Planctomycetota bacterium]
MPTTILRSVGRGGQTLRHPLGPVCKTALCPLHGWIPRGSALVEAQNKHLIQSMGDQACVSFHQGCGVRLRGLRRPYGLLRASADNSDHSPNRLALSVRIRFRS